MKPNILTSPHLISDRLLAHILAGEFGTGSELEGGRDEISLNYLRNFFLARRSTSLPYGIQPEVMEDLSNASDYSKITRDPGEIQKVIINAFTTLKPTVMTGGWIGAPTGHAIYYEIIPRVDGKADLRVYNLGGGIESFSQIAVGRKAKANPVVEWQGVSYENFVNPAVSSVLSELSNLITFDNFSNTDYRGEDIYTSLKELLMPESEVLIYDSWKPMTVQRGGWCSWKSLLAYVRTKMNEKEYKIFKCDIKLQALVDNFNSGGDGSLSAVGRWRLIHKALSSVSRNVDKLYSAGLVGPEYLEKAHALLAPMAQWVKANKNMDLEQPVLPKVEDVIFTKLNAGLTKLTWNKGDIIISESAPLANLGSSQLSAKQRYGGLLEQVETSLKGSVEERLKLVPLVQQAWVNGLDYESHMALNRLIGSLPIAKEGWMRDYGKDPEKAKQLILQLSDLQSIYIKTCWTLPQAEIMFPEKILNAFKILYIQCHLAQLLVPPEIWKEIKPAGTDFGIFLNPAGNHSMFYFHLFDAKQDAEFMEIARWFANESSYPLSGSIRSGLKLTSSDESGISLGDKISQIDPDLIPKVAQEVLGFNLLSKEKRDAHVLMSPHVPPWIFKGIINSSVLARSLTRTGISNLTTLDRAKDLNLSVEHKDDKISFQLSRVKVPDLNWKAFQIYYPPFKSQKLTTFLNGMMNWESAVNERLLLGKNRSEELNPKEWEEYLELAYVNLNPDLCLLSTLSLFQRNPHLLFDPDYQQLFEMLIFQPGYFQKAMQLEGFEDRCAKFIEEGVQKCLKDNQISGAVFLARMARYFSQLSTHTKLKEYQMPLLRKLLQIEGLDISQKGAIYNEICAALSQKEVLDPQDMEDTLMGSVFLQRHPLPVNATNEYIKYDIVSNLFRHAGQLEKALLPDGKPNQRLLNSILKGFKPDAKEVVWEVRRTPGEFPMMYSLEGNYEYYPLKAEVVFPGATVPLPYTLTNHETFKRLFPSVEKGVQLPGNVYAFKDPKKGYETRVIMREGKLIIDQLRGKHNKSWYRYVPHQDIDFQDKKIPYSPLFSRYLAEGHFQPWRQLTDDNTQMLLYLVDPATNKKIYLSQYDKTANGLKIRGLRRYDPSSELGVTSDFMKSFEEPQNVHEWYQHQKLNEIELPRYKLNFKVDPADASKLECVQFPGFYLKPGEVIKKTGAYRHYLVLQDAHGNKKALFPAHHFDPPSGKKEVFEPRYEINWDTKIVRPQRYYVFEVMKNGKLFSKVREANLYLAEVSLLMQNYKQTAALLKMYSKKLRPYKPAEIEILQKIAQMNTVTGNIEGNAIGVQMYASYLLEENFKKFPPEKKEGEKEEKTHLAENYLLYLDHFNAIHELRLTAEEEQYVIRNLKQNSLAIKHRSQEIYALESKEGEELFPEYTQKPFEEIYPDLTRLKFSDYEPWNYRPNINISNITRMGSSLERANRVELYQLLRDISDPVSVYNLKAGLIFWKNSAKGEQDILKTYLFTLILHHQSEFPSVPADLNKDKFDSWWKDVMDTAQRLAKSHPALIPAPHKKELEGGTVKIVKPSKIEMPMAALDLTEIPSLKKEGLVGEPSQAWFTALSWPPTQTGAEKKEPLNAILDKLLTVSMDKDKNIDPLVQREVARLKEDLLEYSKQSKTPYYRLNGMAIQEMETFYTGVISSEKEGSHNFHCDQLVKQIVALANKPPVTPYGKARKGLLEWGGQQKPLKLGELIINFAKQDASALRQRNPALFPADIKSMYEKIGAYLQLQTQRQQAQRVLKKLDDLKKLKAGKDQDLEKINAAVQQLALEATASRSYTLAQNPAFLVFEYIENIIMKPQQIQMIADFLNNKDVQAIRELIMGSGKSKVLMPILAFLRADGKHLSTVIVPEALHPSVSSDTQEKLRDAFNIELHTLEFDRNTEFSIETLENILVELQSIRDNKECLIITSKSVQCLLLKFIEKASEHFSSSADPKPMTPELKLMRHILALISTDSYPLLDEADLLLNVLHEVSFSLGKRNAPIQQEIELIGDLYTLIYTDPKIKMLMRVESDPNGNTKAPLLTEAVYHSSVKRPLAVAFVENLKNKEFDDRGLQKKVNDLFTFLKDSDKELVLAYLCRTKDKIKESQAYYDQQPQEIREILALAGEEISNLLPHSLLKSCDEKYGVDQKQGGILAIPFSSANTPSRGSEFANHHITMNYTLQSYVQKGIPKHVLISQLLLLQESARREIIESAQKISLQDTQAWQLFCKIKGVLKIPFFNLTEAQTEKLLAEINQNAPNRLRMVQNFLLPQIAIFDKKISSNSHNLSSFYKIIWGFTGALWNSASMHRKLTPQTTKGTDALTLSALWNNSYAAIHTDFAGSSKSMMEQLKKSGLQFDVLIDTGGYFKEIDNFNNAEQLGSQLKKPVVFYDHQGDQALWEASGTSLLAESPFKNQEELRGTFLDQAHTTGADVTQKPLAVGLVSIGAGMLLRDLLQSVWRMRGLDKAQRIEFIISKDVEILMQQVLKKGPRIS